MTNSDRALFLEQFQSPILLDEVQYLDYTTVARDSGIQAVTVKEWVGMLQRTGVFAEIFKFIQNHAKDWQLYFWRTKEGEEIDFLIVTPTGRVVALDAKLSMQQQQAINLPANFEKNFP